MSEEIKCMGATRNGEKAYTLKDISHNEKLTIPKLRYDIKVGALKPDGKSMGSYYVLQSELNRYLRKVIGRHGTEI